MNRRVKRLGGFFVQPPKRTAGLDGLRGLAAVTVALGHFFFLFPQNRWTPLWKYSPLYVLIAGREAVVLFFVLSGFALHRMIGHRANFIYSRFVLRRVIRIYGPYLVALTLAVAANFWLARGPKPGFSEWFNTAWPLPVRVADVRAHVLFLGDYDTTVFNGAFWSLIHEMRISLLFPLLDWLVRGRGITFGVCVAAAMLVTGTLLSPLIGEPNNLGETLHYAGLFVAGILLAERPALRIRAIWIIVGIVLFYYGRGLARLFPAEYADLLDLPVGLGAALIVAYAVKAKWLLGTTVQWLGRRSFSLYLIHTSVLLALVNLLHMKQPHIALLWLYLPVTMLVTELFYRGVEQPLLKLSRQAAELDLRR